MPEPISTSSAENGRLDVQHINERVLALILSVRNASDLSAENVAKQTGLTLWSNPKKPGHFGASGGLTGAWRYSLWSMASIGLGPAPYPLKFEMGVTGDKNADMTPICIGPDFYQRALTAAGYTLSELPPHGGVEFRYFNRDKVGVRVHLRGKTKRYVDEHLCVFKVVIGAAQ